MPTLRFSNAIYDGKAIDAATKIYAGHATISCREEGEYYELDVSAPDPTRAQEVADELGNYALALSIEYKKRA